jgi:hypothetical protein
MVNPRIEGVDDDLYAQLKSLAASKNRSISHHILFFIGAVSGKEIPAKGNQNSGPGVNGFIRLMGR